MKDTIKKKINKLACIYFRKRSVPKNGIFLLGHDRAGTTWVGNTLSLPEDVLYLHEPINETASAIGNWEAYNHCLRSDDRDEKYEFIFDHAARGIAVRELTRKELMARLPGRARIVIKETGGMLCGEWFEQRYGGQIILLIRHPAPTILSNMRMGEANAGNWLRQLSSQERIMDPLSERQTELVRGGREASVWRQFALVYCLRYGEALRQLEENPQWIYRRYEDICANPEEEFRELYEKLGLVVTDEIRKTIKEKTTTDESRNFFGTKRDTHRQLNKWQKRIGQEQVNELRGILDAFHFPEYGDTKEWL